MEPHKASLGFEKSAPKDKLPIVYSRHYDIRFFGLETQHPFDTTKYGKIYRYLLQRLSIARRRFYYPSRVTRRQLLSVHTLDYLRSLRSPEQIAQIAELPVLTSLPGWLLYWKILIPLQYATGGTILGVELALCHGWCINLAGGYHHATGTSGTGFCFYADIPIAVFQALRRYPGLSVLIVDLDAHQSNGCAEVFRHDANIHILDIYNPFIFPCDRRVRQYVDFDCPVFPTITEADYLALVRAKLQQAITSCAPALIIYNAGTDILEGDPLGGMLISEQGIIQRDASVFAQALAQGIPILMLLAGGYGRQNALVIAHSLENLLKRVLFVDTS
jgi:histone deacetylase 11